MSAHSKTGRSYTRDLHTVGIGDLILWNDKWYMVQNVHRSSEVARHLAVRLDLYSTPALGGHGFGTATGEECQPVVTVPRTFVKKEQS